MQSLLSKLALALVATTAANAVQLEGYYHYDDPAPAEEEAEPAGPWAGKKPDKYGTRQCERRIAAQTC